jgi:hypothetical protein
VQTTEYLLEPETEYLSEPEMVHRTVQKLETAQGLDVVRVLVDFSLFCIPCRVYSFCLTSEAVR